uniref:PEP-CTERM sorting domain-containing protein n=1 Tax=Schlesneria paludicola TaxID=360056 RepID=A0A7C2JYT2_9PLAN
MFRSAVALLVAAWCSTSDAAIVTVLSGGGNGVANFSGPGLLAVDPLFNSTADIVLDVEVEAGDLPSPLAFNSIVSNLTGFGWSGYTMTLSGANWSFVGDVDSGLFGGVLSVVPGFGPVAGMQSVVTILFDPLEPDGFDLGDPFLLGNNDFGVDISALSAGDHFTLTLSPTAVPEPTSLALAGCGACLMLLRRRNKRTVTASPA